MYFEKKTKKHKLFSEVTTKQIIVKIVHLFHAPNCTTTFPSIPTLFSLQNSNRPDFTRTLAAASGMLLDYCCCFGGRSSGDVADHDPVLLVSGIAGSILHSKKKILGISYETRVWVRFLLADLEFRRELWALYNPETGLSFPFYAFQ